MATVEEQDVVDQLREYDRQFSKILDLIASKSQLSCGEVAEAQEGLRRLKANLEADCQYLDWQRSELSFHERVFLSPALRMATAELMVKPDTIPGKLWHSNLCGALVNITHMLHQLEPGQAARRLMGTAER